VERQPGSIETALVERTAAPTQIGAAANVGWLLTWCYAAAGVRVTV
jgi:hypothetical protein